MAIINTQPSNVNFLSPLKFTFQMKKLPNVNVFVQQCMLPNIALGRFDIPTPFVKLPMAGDHLEFGEFQLTFRVDEDMKNYKEIYNWMMALGFPDKFDQYKSLADKDTRLFRGATGADSLVSDATLIIHNSNVNSNQQITFLNMYPTTIQDILFDFRQTDVEYVECLCTFAYERYDIKDIT